MFSKYLLGGGIVAAIVGLWRQLRELVSKIRSLVIVRAEINDPISSAVIYWCWKNLTPIRLGDRKFCGEPAFVRPRGRYETVAYEIIGHSSLLFHKGPRLLAISKPEYKENRATPDLAISFIRGTWNLDELIIEATELFNSQCRGGLRSHRYVVEYKFGSLGRAPRKSEEVAEAPTTPITGTLDWPWNKRVLRWSLDDIGQVASSTAPFENLYFSSDVWAAVEDALRWGKSRKWYEERGIPWKRGWLLCGPPGTGKTSLARAIAQLLDVPVFVLVLSTFTDVDLQQCWASLQNQVPCIVLIEDIDTVFRGRKNITPGGQLMSKLSFTMLLNAIDGILHSDGVFTIITSNCIEHVDPALGGRHGGSEATTRPGRIDRIIELGSMPEECRRALAQRMLPEHPQEVERIVRETDGQTPAQVRDRCVKVALKLFWRGEDHERRTASISTAAGGERY